jgi:hypothetical protein
MAFWRVRRCWIPCVTRCPQITACRTAAEADDHLRTQGLHLRNPLHHGMDSRVRRYLIVWFSQQSGINIETCVAIPTTSGTGSEVTSACVISFAASIAEPPPKPMTTCGRRACICAIPCTTVWIVAIVWFSQQSGINIETCVAIPTTSGTGSEVTSACAEPDDSFRRVHCRTAAEADDHLRTQGLHLRNPLHHR